MIRHTIITCLLLLAAGMAAGQKYPERRDIRSGNKFYGKAEYSEAEISYRKALEKQPDSYEANFNLADALYKQKRYDEAAGLNEQLAAAYYTCQTIDISPEMQLILYRHWGPPHIDLPTNV